MKRILILDDVEVPGIVTRFNYVDFINDDDEKVQLFIFTSTNGVSEIDKKSSHLIEYKEVDHPSTDGTLEIWANEIQHKYSLTHIYTKNEELIIRAAYLRNLFGIKNGLQSEDVAFYREKVKMKECARQGGFLVPNFERILAPATILKFIEQYGYPVVIKPTMGCAVSGVEVIKDEEELKVYFKKKLFSSIDLGQRADFVGETMIESFVNGRIYNVNGYAYHGQIQQIWPFEYLHTCLEFALHGKAYGNSSIRSNEPLYTQLKDAAQNLLSILPTPDNLVFHLELYENVNFNGTNGQFILCEIAARGPGGSIGALIDIIEGERFAEIDFRVSNELPVSKKQKEKLDIIVSDLVIPRQKGKLMYIPLECPIQGINYIPIAKCVSSYTKYDVNTTNSACRMVAVGNDREETQKLVYKGLEWFESSCIITNDNDSSTQTLSKEIYRFLHKLFL
ncbi:unnamed protein product [Didymodactylos carnosus]|uniref:ATP-grasp domain-containing protein n=1 Tax=Didymodactylos carnosus TaxID=1234261 RepID=A0A814GQV7_9BILA|nr:unnamed protein product [Didymodactylos carnosus]CAF1473980.1 unnamed protein product [Didymodactylos carnosus]CAF3771520.1 unnamed protein product [Didymodactylos carnosus]CAF4265336.1 unnamed protein product [Didymodactylos carnosus]